MYTLLYGVRPAYDCISIGLNTGNSHYWIRGTFAVRQNGQVTIELWEDSTQDNTVFATNSLFVPRA